MSRNWTEKHILELINQTGINSGINSGETGRSELREMLAKDTGLELKMSVTYPSFLDGNMTYFHIDIPERTILLTARYAEMFAQTTKFTAPIELTININSPFVPIPSDGFLGSILKTRPIVYNVIGGWINDTSLTVEADSSLTYPTVTITPMIFNNLKDDDGHLFNITEETGTLWIDSTTTIPASFYKVYASGLIEWPKNEFHLHTELPFGG